MRGPQKSTDGRAENGAIAVFQDDRQSQRTLWDWTPAWPAAFQEGHYLLLDELPDDAGHLVTIHLHHRLRHLDPLVSIWKKHTQDIKPWLCPLCTELGGQEDGRTGPALCPLYRCSSLTTGQDQPESDPCYPRQGAGPAWPADLESENPGNQLNGSWVGLASPAGWPTYLLSTLGALPFSS